jgi:hypothetical protein
MLPINFDSKDENFDFFLKNNSEEILNKNFHQPKVTTLKNVRIATNSVVFRYFKVFQDSCISEENYKRYSKLSFFFKFIFPKINFSKKRFLLITDEWTGNYYHWHAIALQRLLWFKKYGLLENSILFLPIKYKTYSFVLASLEKFGVGGGR